MADLSGITKTKIVIPNACWVNLGVLRVVEILVFEEPQLDINVLASVCSTPTTFPLSQHASRDFKPWLVTS
jgi:hypothetical protein